MARREIAYAAIFSAALLINVVGFAERIGTARTPAAGRSAEAVVGRDLDRRFVDALISRYEDTVTLAERERTHGHDPELRRLAGALVEARKNDLHSLKRFAGTVGVGESGTQTAR